MALQDFFHLQNAKMSLNTLLILIQIFTVLPLMTSPYVKALLSFIYTFGIRSLCLFIIFDLINSITWERLWIC